MRCANYTTAGACTDAASAGCLWCAQTGKCELSSSSDVCWQRALNAPMVQLRHAGDACAISMPSQLEAPSTCNPLEMLCNTLAGRASCDTMETCMFDALTGACQPFLPCTTSINGREVIIGGGTNHTNATDGTGECPLFSTYQCPKHNESQAACESYSRSSGVPCRWCERDGADHLCLYNAPVACTQTLPGFTLLFGPSIPADECFRITFSDDGGEEGSSGSGSTGSNHSSSTGASSESGGDNGGSSGSSGSGSPGNPFGDPIVTYDPRPIDTPLVPLHVTALLSGMRALSVEVMSSETQQPIGFNLTARRLNFTRTVGSNELSLANETAPLAQRSTVVGEQSTRLLSRDALLTGGVTVTLRSERVDAETVSNLPSVAAVVQLGNRSFPTNGEWRCRTQWASSGALSSPRPAVVLAPNTPLPSAVFPRSCCLVHFRHGWFPRFLVDSSITSVRTARMLPMQGSNAFMFAPRAGRSKNARLSCQLNEQSVVYWDTAAMQWLREITLQSNSSSLPFLHDSRTFDLSSFLTLFDGQLVFHPLQSFGSLPLTAPQIRALSEAILTFLDGRLLQMQVTCGEVKANGKEASPLVSCVQMQLAPLPRSDGAKASDGSLLAALIRAFVSMRTGGMPPAAVGHGVLRKLLPFLQDFFVQQLWTNAADDYCAVPDNLLVFSDVSARQKLELLPLLAAALRGGLNASALLPTAPLLPSFAELGSDAYWIGSTAYSFVRARNGRPFVGEWKHSSIYALAGGSRWERSTGDNDFGGDGWVSTADDGTVHLPPGQAKRWAMLWLPAVCSIELPPPLRIHWAVTANAELFVNGQRLMAVHSFMQPHLMNTSLSFHHSASMPPSRGMYELAISATAPGQPHCCTPAYSAPPTPRC
jgi:hypothetical protein